MKFSEEHGVDNYRNGLVNHSKLTQVYPVESKIGAIREILNNKAISNGVTLAVNLVENIGVEPTTSCMPCKRSSQLS